ncbi:MAG: FAD-dependent oxidoreductase [Candidatus Hadarchaeota archaeon]
MKNSVITGGVVIHDLIIVGGGPAGMTAGIYGVRSGLKTLVLEKMGAGGLTGSAPRIENYPGFDSITGVELVEKIKAHTTEYLKINEFEPVVDIKIGETIRVRTEKSEYETKALILATGTSHTKLRVKGENEFFGKGVSHCAACDGFFFRGKKVAVVGGGSHAAEDAIYLDGIDCEVILIHNGDKLDAEEYLQKKIAGRLKVVLNTKIEEIFGDKLVKGIRVRNLKENTKNEFEVSAVFVAVGETPDSIELASKIGVRVDSSGFIITDKDQRTNVPRVYAAGDVSGGFKQIVVACAQGAVAAISAYKDLRAAK